MFWLWFFDPTGACNSNSFSLSLPPSRPDSSWPAEFPPQQSAPLCTPPGSLPSVVLSCLFGEAVMLPKYSPLSTLEGHLSWLEKNTTVLIDLTLNSEAHTRCTLSTHCTLSIPFQSLHSPIHHLFDIFSVLKPPRSFPPSSWGYYILVYWKTVDIRRELPLTLITSPPSTFHSHSFTLPSVPSYTVVPFAIRSELSRLLTTRTLVPILFHLLALAIVLSLLYYLGDSKGQGSLACCRPWGCKEPDMT